MRLCGRAKCSSLVLIALSLPAFFCQSLIDAAESQLKTKIRIATASPSLSYLPIYTAVKKGFFAKRGFDVEMIQMSASLTAPALLNRSIDYTTIPSTIVSADLAPATIFDFSFAATAAKELAAKR